MGVIGAELAMKSKKLGSMGKEMPACAISQGEPNAYASLGMIAMWEGIWSMHTGCLKRVPIQAVPHVQTT
jgi:hypothetical protein